MSRWSWTLEIVAMTSCLESLLMSRIFRRYVECLIVVWAPWVLLFEQPATTMEDMEGRGEDETEDLHIYSGPVSGNGQRG
jgi:hypothetical protein